MIGYKYSLMNKSFKKLPFNLFASDCRIFYVDKFVDK